MSPERHSTVSWSRLVAPAVVAFGVFMLTCLGVGTPFGLAPAGATSCAASPGDHVAVVIDFGAAPDAPSGLLARCVVAGSGWTGKQALIGAAGSVGRDSSGKICQIAGIPARFDPGNCSAPHDGVISYWSYFKGTSAGWSYSSVGDAHPSNRVDPQVVEGWRFVEIADGATKSYDPPRNFPDGFSSAWQSTCPPAAPPPVPSVPPRQPSLPANGSHARQPDALAESAQPAAGAASRARSHPRPTTSAVAGTTSTAASPTTSPNASDGETAAGAEVRGLTSSQTAKRVTLSQVRAAADKADRSVERSYQPWVMGGGILVCVAVVMAAVTYRSRMKRHDSS